MRLKFFIFTMVASMFFHVKVLSGQLDTTETKATNIVFGGYIDAYYVFDFNQPKTSYRQSFLYNHNRHNEFNLNLGFIRISTKQQRYRANLALQAGTYANDNYANEPGLLKNIFEANAGISLNKRNTLWLDAGIFASHIGFESAISLDNWTLTRSILAENSPYYLSGARLSYKPNQKTEWVAVVCNGWQHIQKIYCNSLPGFGTQLKVIPNDRTTLNWSTFIGTEDPDSTRRMRYFNNLFGQFQWTEKFGLIAGFDMGIQQRTKNNVNYDFWLSPVFIGQFVINKNWKTAIRAEYYQDEKGIIIPTGTIHGFKTSGLSLNIDYNTSMNAAFRVEGRWLKSQDKIFETKSTPTKRNFIIASSIAIKF